MLSYENTAAEISNSGTDLAIIPIGSVEQHGSHLPLGTDCFIAEAVAKGVAEKMDGYLLPVLPISTCYEHMGTKGSVCMRPGTFYQMLQDIVLNLYRQGFHRIVLIIGHGGVYISGPAVRELNALYDDLQVLDVGTGSCLSRQENVVSEEMDVHAGEGETSLMLYLREELVQKEMMMQNDYVPKVPRNFLNYVPLPRLSKTGVWGQPSLATKEKGEYYLKTSIRNCVEYIEYAFSVALKEKW